MKYICFFLMFLWFAIQNGMAQKEDVQKKVEFTPVGLIFANVHIGQAAFSDVMGFQLRRAYLGYKFKFDDHFSGELVLDVGNPGDTDEGELRRRFAFFKKAYIRYKNGKFTLDAGMVSTRQFRVQEKIWSYRYIGPSPMDLYRMGPSADLGIIVDYKFNEVLNIDLSLTNGEGYTNLQMDTAFRCAIGLTVHPLKPITLRVYYDITPKHIPQATYSAFLAYSWKDKIVMGMEYDYQTNTDFFDRREFTIISSFLRYSFLEKWSSFVRLDRLYSNESIEGFEFWNYINDGFSYWGGVDYILNRHIKLAIDIRYHIPDNKEERNQPFLFLNSEIRL